MSSRFGVCSVLRMVLSLPHCDGSENSETVPRGIPRFSRVTGGLYRGGQPDRAGFEWLKRKGIQTVINLRTTNGHRERAVVERLDMTYIHIPVSLLTELIGMPLNPWKRLPEAAVDTFLRAVGDPANHPVFVHCHRGKDRTGTMIAFYRIAAWSWDAEGAYREARDKGLSWWFQGVKRQLREFAERRPGNAGVDRLAACSSARGHVNGLPAPSRLRLRRS